MDRNRAIMTMTDFVIFAVVNLGIGFLAAQVMLDSAAAQDPRMASSIVDGGRRERPPTMQPTKSEDASNAVDRPALSGEANEPQHAATHSAGQQESPTGRATATWDEPHSWSTLVQQLRTLNDRVGYAAHGGR